MADSSKKQGDTKESKEDEYGRDEGDTVDEGEEGDNSEEDDDEGEDEPKLKYARLTSKLGPLYRNGDATSTFLVAGDKMVSIRG